MAFHCRSVSHSSSSAPRGVEIDSGNGNGNGYQQFEDTVPLDDAMALDSPLAETQLEKLDFDTQVVDDFDCHEEVVVDSEDESICKNKRENVPNYQLSNHNALNLQRRASAYVDEQSDVGNKGCEANVEKTDEQKDLSKLFSCNIGSSEPEDASQANALEFVNQFLSFNKVETSPGLDIKKYVGEKSPPVSRAKGPHILAKRMKPRVTPLAKPGTFERADRDQHISKRKGIPSEFGGFRQTYVRRDQKARHLNSKGGSISGNEHKEKKDFVNMHKEMVGSTHSDSRFLDHSAKETNRIEQEFKLNRENNTVKEFNEDLHAELSEQQLDTPEMFDVGFNTQIAAEAMEALSYGPHAGCITFDASEGPLNNTEDSLRATTIREDLLEHSSLSKSDFSDVEVIARKSKRRKRSAGKSGKKSNNWGLHPELLIMKKVKRVGEQFNCKSSANSNKNSRRRSPNLIIQRQLHGPLDSNNEKCENNLSSPLSVEHVLLRTEQAEGKIKISSTLADETRQSLAGDTFKRTNDQSDNPGESKEYIILKYRRKRSRSVVNRTKVASAIGRCSELLSDSSSEARNSRLSQKELTCKKVTAITTLKLDIRSHPKGKRTLHKVQSRLKSNTSYAPLATINGNVGKSYCIRSQRRTDDEDKTSCDNVDTKGKIQSELHSSSRYSSEDLRKNFEPGSAVVISNTEPASRCKEIFPTEPEKQLSFKQSSKAKDLDCLLFSNGAEKKSKFGVSSKRNFEPFGSGYYKRPFNKNLPKSSLLKELIKLGVPESITDFTWKDLRRRRDIAYVRVLFSQHLDDNIIKQQKKISARLGISIATCPMDATHFIADRFVRTRNMLEAISLGKPVVTHLWLESCGQASCLIDEKNYILRDAKKEKEIGFSMPVSFARANQHPLLKGLRVFITPNIKPPKEMITSLVKAVHGQVVERSQISAPKDRNIQDDLLILSCEEDHAFCVPFLNKEVAAYSSELLLNGIVIQKLEFERHRLFKNHGERK